MWFELVVWIGVFFGISICRYFQSTHRITLSNFILRWQSCSINIVLWSRYNREIFWVEFFEILLQFALVVHWFCVFFGLLYTYSIASLSPNPNNHLVAENSVLGCPPSHAIDAYALIISWDNSRQFNMADCDWMRMWSAQSGVWSMWSVECVECEVRTIAGISKVLLHAW